MWLKYKVNGQKIIADRTNEKPVVGTKGVLGLSFDFDAEWRGKVVVCEFSNHYNFDESEACMVKHNYVKIPDKFTDETTIYFRLFYKDKNNGNVNVTERMLIEQRR